MVGTLAGRGGRGRRGTTRDANQMPTTPPIGRLAPALAVLMAWTTLGGCGAGREVTPAAIREARGTWLKTGVRDYDLEWTSAGPRNAHYRVFVRDGAVRMIYSVLPDGREFEAKPAEPKFYGVDGLFLVIEDDLAQLKQPRPFGQAKGASTVMRFDPDPTYGYPRSFRRDVSGSPTGLAIDVVRFDPKPPAEIPPPADRADAPASAAARPHSS